jgi:predicted N-acyltransferase
LVDRAVSHDFRLCGSYHEVDGQQWNALLGAQGAPTPFLRWEFLAGLEDTSCTVAETGWQPLPLVLCDGDGHLVAGAPAYLKGHSYGEYVFDWAWADAYGRAGLEYFPKLLVASPFSPIAGSRLLAPQGSPEIRRALLTALRHHAESSGLSSVHVLYPDDADLAGLRAEGWLIREGVQFHWQNPGFETFEDYLAALTQPKRKKIKAERRKVQQHGVATRMVRGAEITPEALAFFYRCYECTYREHHATPYLSFEFFARLLATMPEQVALCLAERDGRPIATSFFLLDGDVLYGRYWGALERVDCLHFEVAYYTPIEWAIGQRIRRFEGGAQGEHKLARGFTPVKTYSGHWLREPSFYDAVARFLERESRGIEAYVDELESRNPFRMS